MRIIDSNKDFYDFYQNIYRDNSLTFDRRDSYVLSKEEFASYFYYDERKFAYYNGNKNKDVLLQIGNQFWLFCLTIKKWCNGGRCTDYDLKLLASWKDYTWKPELIKLSYIDIHCHEIIYMTGSKHPKGDNVNKKIEALRYGDYRVVKTFDDFNLCKGHCLNIEKRHIPILQHIGIASLVDPLEIYLALEEYLGTLKTESERTESVGLTNDEKITNHGFDLKTSFR